MLKATIRHVEDRGVWNEFVLKHTNDTFHQSWEWGEIYKKLGEKAWYIGVFNDQAQQIAACLAVKITAKRGSFIHVPHGPVFNKNIKGYPGGLGTILRKLKSELISIAQKQNCVFVRVAPTLERNKQNNYIFTMVGFRDAPIFVQSELSWRLNITKSEEELMKDMRKSTRYILRRADKHTVVYKKSQSPKDFDRFFDVYKKTVQSQDFIGQGYDFIKEEFTAFSLTNSASLYFIEKNRSILATALIIHQGKSGFYHYGASVRNKNNIPAPHLLQWYIINDLKRQGYVYYNFWGIAPENKPNHPWVGLSRFKKGFGGEPLKYLQTKDYPLKWSYWFNWVVETIRRIKRNY